MAHIMLYEPTWMAECINQQTVGTSGQWDHMSPCLRCHHMTTDSWQVCRECRVWHNRVYSDWCVCCSCFKTIVTNGDSMCDPCLKGADARSEREKHDRKWDTILGLIGDAKLTEAEHKFIYESAHKCIQKDWKLSEKQKVWLKKILTRCSAERRARNAWNW
eukprot:TRINITY_DN17177_c0_g1_i1.p1 TRINITY_DN17177_c0_g1~~TRINITY_DN17177_c0_g1_i1.p1  ORF type:complete len:161 (-),score=6.58 TRINITY_DN17177_c0_g1_i1:186-668(-)